MQELLFWSFYFSFICLTSDLYQIHIIESSLTPQKVNKYHSWRMSVHPNLLEIPGEVTQWRLITLLAVCPQRNPLINSIFSFSVWELLIIFHATVDEWVRRILETHPCTSQIQSTSLKRIKTVHVRRSSSDQIGNHVGPLLAAASCAIQVDEIWLTLLSLSSKIFPSPENARATLLKFNDIKTRLRINLHMYNLKRDNHVTTPGVTVTLQTSDEKTTMRCSPMLAC